jgi:hypothetical protein
MKRTFTRNEIEDLVDEGVAIEINSRPFKHDIVLTTYVAKVEELYWKFIIESSYNEGWCEYQFPIDAVRVSPREVSHIEWVEHQECPYLEDCLTKAE